MIELKDRIYTNCDTVGTGNIVVGMPREGYQGWDVISNGNTVYYCIIADTQWEVGYGVKTDTEITRNILASSMGELMSLDGSASVFCTYPAEKSVVLDTDGNLPVSKDIIAGGIIESSSVVKAPMIVTDAVLVGGDADDEGAEITEILDVYTKGEVDKLQSDQDEAWEALQTQQDEEWAESQLDQDKRWDTSQKAQDTKINENKSSIQGLASDLESTQRDVVELEEEIEALAPSFDRGRWKHDETTTIKGSPDTGSYYLTTDTEVTNQFNDTKKIYFNNVDAEDPPQTHTFDDVTEGMYIEVFEALDSSYLLATVDTITKESGYTVMDLTVVKAEGEAGLSEEETPDISTSSSQEGIRVKFFTLADTGVDLDSLMPKSGGTFTGDVKIDRGDLHVKASNTGNGISFQVWNGNDYQQLLLNGEGNFQYRRPNNITLTTDTVARLSDIDEISLHSLTSDLTTPFYYRAPKNLGSNEFALNATRAYDIRFIYIYKLYTRDGSHVAIKNYSLTPSTELEIRETDTGLLLFNGLIKSWEVSSYASGDRILEVAKPSYARSGYNFSTSKKYTMRVTNLTKD